MYSLLREPDVAKTIKLGALSWTGLYGRIAAHEILRKLLVEDLYGAQRKGRSKLRWVDGVREYARTPWSLELESRCLRMSGLSNG